MSISALHAQDGVVSEAGIKHRAASQLSQWCDRLIELGWIAALIIAPLFFNIYSSRVFEPDKISTVRSIALMMCVLWVVKWFEERKNPAADRRISWRTPLVLPTLLMVAIYMISTFTSVAPRTSLLGSYQRLQGTYSTLSYIVIFLMMVQGMRTRAQLNRLINLLIINSLPIALYGASQRYGLDPLPWGGDTTTRVAGNMGNAIFIAAYLIMTFFLALGKIGEIAIQVLRSERTGPADVLRLAGYLFIAALQAFVVMVLAGSRGPQLGWLFGIFFFVLLGAQLLQKRSLRTGVTLGASALGLLGMVSIVVLNVSNSPALDGVRSLPVINRLSTALDLAEGTNLVRALIWEGNVNMMSPHEPIDFPDGTQDAYNAIRPLIGYGPESMYVAYNRFYPPALANVEARNASPDRSHNETWDSIVITGIIGLLAYLFVFGSVFYYGFKWIGLIRTRAESVAFALTWILSAAAGGFGFWMALNRPSLFGVGVGMGTAIGMVLFIIGVSISHALRRTDDDSAAGANALPLMDRMLLIGIVSAILAHFLEIHVGIAIGSTRTHFWALCGLMVLIGMRWVEHRQSNQTEAVIEPVVELAANPVRGSATKVAQPRRVSHPVARRGNSATPAWFFSVLVDGILLGFILGVMSYTVMSNFDQSNVPGRVIWNTFTMLPARGTLPATISFGVGLLFVVSWLIGTLILTLDSRAARVYAGYDAEKPAWLPGLLILTTSLFVWFLAATLFAGRLVNAIHGITGDGLNRIMNLADALADLPVFMYLFVLTVVTVAGWLLVRNEESRARAGFAGAGGVSALLILGLGLPLLANFSNLQPIRADIIYKMANPYDGQASNVLQPNTNFMGWDIGIEHHRKAIALAPNEDFYYLWLGRGLLEKGKSTTSKAAPTWSDNTDVSRILVTGPNAWNATPQNPLPSAGLGKEDLLNAAKGVLVEARRINPLNTDHSANLARMYRQAGDTTADEALRRQRYAESERSYDSATKLSPNNAQLFNEWSTLLYGVGKVDEAQKKIEYSLTIDKKFEQTYLIKGDFAAREADKLSTEVRRVDALRKANPAPDAAALATLNTSYDATNTRYIAQLRTAQDAFTAALKLNPQLAQVLRPLADINVRLGDTTLAIDAMNQLSTLSPNDWTVWRTLADLQRSVNKPKALEAAQKSLTLAPADQRAGVQGLIDELQK